MVLDVPGTGRLEVAMQGAHALSWRTADGQERLYLSPLAAFDGHTAIRGGVPVCFPQFGRGGPLVPHGFARLRRWTLAPEDPASPATLVFRLHDDAATRAVWPWAFDATLAIRLGAGQLEHTLSVHNAGPEPFAFTAALHTYLAVGDARRMRLAGLPPDVDVAAGVDRVLADHAGPVTVHDAAGSIVVRQGGGFGDTVVWQPGVGAPADVPVADAHRFLCVEPACVTQPAVVAPADVWAGWQCLAVAD